MHMFILTARVRASSVDIVTGYRLDGRGVGTQVLSGSTFVLHSIQTGSLVYPAFCAMATGAVSKALKRPGLEADHSPPTYVGVKNARIYTSKDNFTFHNIHSSAEA
jgi:hypothetical protein